MKDYQTSLLANRRIPDEVQMADTILSPLRLFIFIPVVLCFSFAPPATLLLAESIFRRQNEIIFVNIILHSTALSALHHYKSNRPLA